MSEFVPDKVMSFDWTRMWRLRPRLLAFNPRPSC